MTTLSNLLALLSLDDSDYLKGLTDSESATSGFTGRLASLGGAVVVGGLAAAATAVTAVGVAAWNAGETMDGAMDSIAVATGAVGPELEALQEDFEAVFTGVPTDAASASDAIGILNSRLDVTGPALQEMARPLLEATRILGGDLTTNAENFTRVMGDWSIPVENGANSLDMLFVAAQQTGAPLDQLMQRIVQYGAPMRNFGFDFADAGAILASFEAQGVNTEIVMSGLRTAQGKFIAQGKDMKTGLWQTIDAISNAEDSTKALAIATDVFGAKAAGDMFDTIRSGKFDVQALSEQMWDARGRIMETGAATADWGEKWSMFKNQITVALAPLGGKMMEGVGAALDQVVAIFERPDVQTALNNFVAMIGEFITQAVAYIPVLIDGFFQFIDFLKNNQGIVVGVLAALGAAALAWGITTAIAAVTAMAPLLPVIAVILLIAGAAYLLYQAWTNNWGGIQEKTAAAWEFIKSLFNAGLQFINDFTNGRLGLLSEIFQTWIENIRLIVQAFQAAFHGDWYRFGELIRQVWNNNWNMLKTVVTTAWENIKSGVRTGITAVVNFFKTTDWGAVGRGIIQGIANGIAAGISIITNAAKNAAKAALDAAKGFLGIRSPSTVFENQVGWNMAAGVAAGWQQGLNAMLTPEMLSLQPGTIDLQARSVSTETGAGGTAASNDLLLQDVRRLLQNLPQEIARMNRDTYLRAGA